MPDLADKVTATRVDNAYRQLIGTLRESGSETAFLDARLLLQHVCAIEHVDLIRDPDRALTADQWAHLRDSAARRLAGEPVSRIVGTRGFWGLNFQLSPETLDPRADTETLVDAVLTAVSARGTTPRRILDLGTGTGCVLIALLSALPDAAGVGTDLSQEAVATARANALHAGISDRVQFLRADWLAGLDAQFDLVVSNPPYIPRREIAALSPEVREYDPVVALDGGADGLDAYRAILKDLDRVISPGTLVAFELGYGQCEAVADLLTRAGLRPALAGGRHVFFDLAKIARVLVMEKP